MDFSWVKELADRSNQLEGERLARERAEKEEQRQLQLATGPFVEKLHLLIATCGEEFNKFVHYQQLRVVTNRIQKRIKGTINPEDPELSYADEVTSFTFTRGDWTFGVRGARGAVEFVEFPGGGSFNLDETAVAPSRKMSAVLDSDSGVISWCLDGDTLDGQMIVSICKDYFREFIEKTNPELG